MEQNTTVTNDDHPDSQRTENTSARSPFPAVLSLRKKLAYSAIVTAVVLVGFEFALFCFWQPPPEEDPYVGFSASAPLLVQQTHSENGETNGFTRVRINPSKRVWFNEQSFLSPKPEGTVRIVCLGGSTTYGRPFSDETSFCGWLRTMLPMADPTQKWEVINAGGISYASYRVARVMQEFAPHDVDVFVLYTGHNEFLEWRTYEDLLHGSSAARILHRWIGGTRLARSAGVLLKRFGPDAAITEGKPLLSAEVDELLNHSIGPADYSRDPNWHRGVVEHFRANLRRMKQISKAAGAGLVVVPPVANLRDCAPFKSEFADDLDPVRRQQLRSDWTRARALVHNGELSRAAESLDAILKQDRQHAEVHFCRGRVALMQGQTDRALRHFRYAINEDICPLRAPDAILRSVKDFASDSDVIGVDFQSHLDALAEQELGHRCVGAESFLDHVHPTVEMHGQLAGCIIESLHRAGVVAAPLSEDDFAAANRLVTAVIDRDAQAVAFRNLAKLTHWAGKFDEARRHAEDTLRLAPADLESRYILADCLEKAGQLDLAIDQYRQLFRVGDFDRALLPYGILLAESGNLEAAKAYLLQSVIVCEGGRQAASYESLGKVHEALGEIAWAKECFEHARRLRGGAVVGGR